MPYPDSEYPSILRGKDKRESQRLLAAAPELLAACEFAASVIDSFVHAEPESTDPEMSEAAKRLWEAIVKAEGMGE